MTALFLLYLRLASGVLAGWFLGRWLPPSVPRWLGLGLFWLGVPLSNVVFLRRADLSGAIWLAPVTAWGAIALGAIAAWLWLQRPALGDRGASLSSPARGSLLLAAMVGNTGYFGFPICLALVGERYFGWAVFYDLLGTTLGANSLGVLLAAYFGGQAKRSWQLGLAVLQNPVWWGVAAGLWGRAYHFAPAIETGLLALGWTIVGLSLLLIGMRLSAIASWQQVQVVWPSITLKMLVVPLIAGLGLAAAGLQGAPQLAIVLQVAMPPAFATLAISEAYHLDRELTAAALATGSASLLVTLPLWVLLFG